MPRLQQWLEAVSLIVLAGLVGAGGEACSFPDHASCVGEDMWCDVLGSCNLKFENGHACLTDVECKSGDCASLFCKAIPTAATAPADSVSTEGPGTSIEAVTTEAARSSTEAANMTLSLVVASTPQPLPLEATTTSPPPAASLEATFTATLLMSTTPQPLPLEATTTPPPAVSLEATFTATLLMSKEAFSQSKQTAYRQSVATIAGVNVQAVAVTKVEEAQTPQRRSADLDAGGAPNPDKDAPPFDGGRRLLAAAIEVETTVEIETFDSSAAVSAALQADLSRDLPSSLNASGIELSSLSSVSVSPSPVSPSVTPPSLPPSFPPPPTSVSPTPSGGDEGGLSSGGLIGIVIGLLLAVAVGVSVWWAKALKQREEGEAAAKEDGEGREEGVDREGGGDRGDRGDRGEETERERSEGGGGVSAVAVKIEMQEEDRPRMMEVGEELRRAGAVGGGGEGEEEEGGEEEGAKMGGSAGEGGGVAQSESGPALAAEGEAKFVAQELVLGAANEAAFGLRAALGLEDDRVLGAKLREGVVAIETEWLQHGSKEDKENLEYVLNGVARDPAWVPAHVKQQIQEGAYHGGSLGEDDFDFEHDGMTLESFVEHEYSRMAGLSRAEVLALRLYTTSSFRRINGPLRLKVKPHPVGMTAYHLAEGLKKLRGVAAEMDQAGFNKVLWLWRGMKDMRVDSERFVEFGGTELAPMSTTTDENVALRYADSMHPLVFKYKARGLGRGCAIDFLSVFPKEREFLYPPLTYLQPEGQPELVGKMTVLVVTPQMP